MLTHCKTPLIVKGTYIRSDKGVLSFGNSPERNFYIDEALGDSLVEIWKNDFYGGFGNQSILAQNGNLFFADLGGRVFIVDAETGRQIGYEENKGEIPVTPIIHQRRIIFGLNNEDEIHSTLIFYDLILGKTNYEVNVDGYIANEFIKLNDGFLVLLQNGTLQKYSFLSRLIWEVKTNEITSFDPAANGTCIVFGNQAGEIITVDMSGKLIKRKKLSNAFESGAVIKKNRAFFGDTDGNLFCISLPDIEIIWRSRCNSKILQVPELAKDAVYLGDLEGNFYSFNILTGEQYWKNPTGGLFNTPGLVFIDKIIQPDFSGRILIFDRMTGQIEKYYDYPNKVNFAPIYHDSKIYWGSYRSYIYAFKRALQ